MSDATSKSDWRSFRFDQLATIVNDRVDDPSEANVDYYVGLEHLDSDSLTIRRWGAPSDVGATKLRFRAGDIIFGRRRVYQRKLGVAQFDGICSAHAMVIRAKPEVVLPEFLPFFMQSDLFMERAKEISVGSLSPTINWKTLAKEQFALPALDEQQRIADVMRELFFAKESLLRLCESATRLRRSFLKSFFPGPNEVSRCVALGIYLKAKVLRLQTGPFGTVLSAAQYAKKGWPVINPTHFRNGRIAHVNGPYVDDKTALRLQEYRMRTGDILLARKGEIDKATVVTSREEGWIVGSDCILLRPESSVLSSEYLLLFLQSPATSSMLRSLAHGTVVLGLNEGMLTRLELPEISSTDQAKQVQLVRELDSRRHAMEERADHIDRLRCSLSASIFNAETAGAT